MRHLRQSKFLEKNLTNYDNNNNLTFDEIFKNKKIILIGCGGVGSVFAELLIRGGFLDITLVDNDIIDETNLQRQIFFEKDIGKSKSKTLGKFLKKINSKGKIHVFETILDYNNIEKIGLNSDLIVDLTDNFETRIIINNYCEKTNKNWLYTGAVKGEISCYLFKGEKKLFSKIFPKKIIDEKCCDIGVLASTTFTAASFAYNQVLKYFLEKNYEPKFIKLNLWTNQIFEIKIK